MGSGLVWVGFGIGRVWYVLCRMFGNVWYGLSLVWVEFGKG